MLHSLYSKFSPTLGEKRLYAAALAVTLAGGAISYSVVTQLGDNKEMLRSLSGADYWFIIAGMVGSFAALFVGRDWFGHGGAAGVLQLVAGMISVTFMGTIIGGTLALPLYGTMFGPMMFGVTIAAHPVLALVWLNALVVAHLLMMLWRRERDSIFTPLMRVPAGVTARKAKAGARQAWISPGRDGEKRRA
ncbi:hypothetical protein [Loktanella salsilacus]|uniref:hypothetical protein n=1 Tax=Loktanella salsilacus TaxID=195913 RepID=UPI00373633FB